MGSTLLFQNSLELKYRFFPKFVRECFLPVILFSCANLDCSYRCFFFYDYHHQTPNCDLQESTFPALALNCGQHFGDKDDFFIFLFLTA